MPKNAEILTGLNDQDETRMIRVKEKKNLRNARDKDDCLWATGMMSKWVPARKWLGWSQDDPGWWPGWWPGWITKKIAKKNWKLQKTKIILVGRMITRTLGWIILVLANHPGHVHVWIYYYTSSKHLCKYCKSYIVCCVAYWICINFVQGSHPNFPTRVATTFPQPNCRDH